MPHHPTPEDHARLKAWMEQKFGAGTINLEKLTGDVYLYQAERPVKTTTVAYTLEITQEAYDHDGCDTILANLDRQDVAGMLLADPGTHLRYLRGGIIVPSPVQP